MNTIDSLLPIIYGNIFDIQQKIPKKDKKILVSLHKQIDSGHFLTENQSVLFVKILKENLTVMKSVISYVDECIDANLWSRKFREIRKVRKISLNPDYPNHFMVEFNFNLRLKDKILKILTGCQLGIVTGTKYFLPLTEEYLFSVISSFKNDNFEIDEKLMDFFQEIVKIKNTSTSPFDVFEIKNEKLKTAIESDIGAISRENLLLLNDRKFRYQYQISEKIHENSLTAKIAVRERKDVYLNRDQFLLTEILKALKTLDRLPILFIFEGHSAKKDKFYIDLVKTAIQESELIGDVGIYFRYNKVDDSDNFNSEISALGYNKDLSDQTIIAGISNSKLPKFMINLGWRPNSIISFTNNFKSNKSFVFFNDVDLIMYYTTAKPFDEKIYEIL